MGSLVKARADEAVQAVAGAGEAVLDEMRRLGVECRPYHSPTTGNWIVLLDPERLHAVTMLRRTLSSIPHVEAMEQLTKQLGRFDTNDEFIQLISGSGAMDSEGKRIG